MSEKSLETPPFSCQKDERREHGTDSRLDGALFLLIVVLWAGFLAVFLLLCR